MAIIGQAPCWFGFHGFVQMGGRMLTRMPDFVFGLMPLSVSGGPGRTRGKSRHPHLRALSRGTECEQVELLDRD